MAKKKFEWPYLQTRQGRKLLSEIRMSKKKDGLCRALIDNTGTGKTAAVDEFERQFPDHTYRITIGSTYTFHSVVNELCGFFDIKWTHNHRWDNRAKLVQVKQSIIEVVEQGGEPIIIFDEAENANPKTLRMMKELYDMLKDVCPIVLIATDQLTDKMTKMIRRGEQGIEQLHRRFKAGIRYIDPINKSKDFPVFFDALIPGNTEVQDLLLIHAENYGELRNYLEPLLRFCAETGQPLTADLFCAFHHLPKPKK